MYLFIGQSVCLSIYFIDLSVSLFICLRLLCVSIDRSISLDAISLDIVCMHFINIFGALSSSICMRLCQHMYCLPVCLYLSLFIYLSINLSICFCELCEPVDRFIPLDSICLIKVFMCPLDISGSMFFFFFSVFFYVSHFSLFLIVYV